jgi:putative transposase
MSRSGNVWDNMAMESFFSSPKAENIGNKTDRTRDEARADVFDYIERFYNLKRSHLALKPAFSGLIADWAALRRIYPEGEGRAILEKDASRVPNKKCKRVVGQPLPQAWQTSGWHNGVTAKGSRRPFNSGSKWFRSGR